MSAQSIQKLKLGTRRSLLAWAQSSWVARQIEMANPSVSVELVGIDTRGDRIQDVSLRTIEGKEFFVAELDDALRSGRVDFTVHSLKDLSVERPQDFDLVAIPTRVDPRDVFLVGPEALSRLKQGKTLKIGTSSPRRLENVPSFLKEALPRYNGNEPELEFVEIRGNVNTRLGRVLENSTSERYLDGVILAFAGLIRLEQDNGARAELAPMLKQVRWMVLPLRENPTAPGQGALAIECRKNDAAVWSALRKIHDADSSKSVVHEREMFRSYGGGCHQRFGITEVQTTELGSVLYFKGCLPNGDHVDELRWNHPPHPASGFVAWDGSKYSRAFDQILNQKPVQLEHQAVFVAHSRAVTSEWSSSLQNARVWVSGTTSWKKLAALGIWVEGCAENLGFAAVRGRVSQPVLGLPALDQWIVLTHESASAAWEAQESQVIATYKVEKNSRAIPEADLEDVRAATHFFWTSGTQFDLFKNFVPFSAHHSCGPGKTLKHLEQLGVRATVFPSSEEWRKWLGIK